MRKNVLFYAVLIMIGCMAADCGGKKGGATTCGELTAKGAADCEKADAVTGKECSFEANACVELTQNIKDFRSVARAFDASLPVGALSIATDKVLGAIHGRCPDWKALCGLGALINNASMDNMVTKLSLEFAKDKKEVKVILDCTKGGGPGTANKTYDLTYGLAPVTTGDALLITIDLNGKDVNGLFEAGRTGNFLEFFSKANWLYSKKKDAVIGISQLGNIGFSGSTLSPKEEKDFDDAIAYQRTPYPNGGGGENIRVDVEAVSFILDKRP